MSKLWKHVRRWNMWRKNNQNSMLHKLQVLFGSEVDIDFCATMLPEDEAYFRKWCEENADKFARVNIVTSAELREILKRAKESPIEFYEERS